MRRPGRCRDHLEYFLENDTAFLAVMRARPRVLPAHDSLKGVAAVDSDGGHGPGVGLGRFMGSADGFLTRARSILIERVESNEPPDTSRGSSGALDECISIILPATERYSERDAAVQSGRSGDSISNPPPEPMTAPCEARTNRAAKREKCLKAAGAGTSSRAAFPNWFPDRETISSATNANLLLFLK